ncbi:MAG: phosphotransferase, partial [Actinomycetota bacterium]
MPTRMHADEVPVDDQLVRRLLASQLPHLAGLALRTVAPWGTDHGVWRLGDELVVRLPRIHWAAGQPEMEATWLPRLGPHLPVVVPEPEALGGPGHGYPFPWADHRWVPGERASLERLGGPARC